jgi:hypothetical protein
MIGHLFWLDSVDRSPVQDGLDSSQVKQILVTGFRGLMHVDCIRAWVKIAPHLNAEGNKQYIHPPVMRCQNSLLNIGCGLSGAGQLTVLSGRLFLCLHKEGLHERPGLGMEFFRP